MTSIVYVMMQDGRAVELVERSVLLDPSTCPLRSRRTGALYFRSPGPLCGRYPPPCPLEGG